MNIYCDAARMAAIVPRLACGAESTLALDPKLIDEVLAVMRDLARNGIVCL